MKRDGHNQVAFFIGPEVEHTPAYSRKTLFVVGTQTVADINKLATEHKVSHIFMGANHSFDLGANASYWDKTITSLLDMGYWVTLDYEAHLHAAVLSLLNAGVWQSRNFVPLLSVRIPNIERSSTNLTVKIDDVDFQATNPGVWCMHYREVTDGNRFTDWTEYSSDVVINTAPVQVVAQTPAAAIITVAVKEEVQVVIKEALNDSLAGLAPAATSELKPEAEVASSEPQKSTMVIGGPAEAAEAYAKGTTVDPLSNKSSRKAGKK